MDKGMNIKFIKIFIVKNNSKKLYLMSQCFLRKKHQIVFIDSFKVERQVLTLSAR